MPLQSRVRPDGELVADPTRGLLLGNRGGRLHDPATRTLGRRRWTSARWISCELAFGGRRREVWGEGYTELFFLDEPTALAAGHRPCYECRRADALAFAAAVARAEGLERAPTAGELDRRLHRERLDGRVRRLHRLDAADLPDGAVVASGDAFLALRDDRALAWTPAAWLPAGARPDGELDVLTPPTALAALAAGFAPRWHPSAEA
ncbi:MAG: hypothetical protein R3C15_20600 [Thermoleophilia bacterium]